MTPDVGENTEETSPYVGDSEEDLCMERCKTCALIQGKSSETDILWERRGTSVENQQATVITLAQLFAEASLDKIGPHRLKRGRNPAVGRSNRERSCIGKGHQTVVAGIM